MVESCTNIHLHFYPLKPLADIPGKQLSLIPESIETMVVWSVGLNDGWYRSLCGIHADPSILIFDNMVSNFKLISSALCRQYSDDWK